MATSFTTDVLEVDGDKLNWIVDEGRYLLVPIVRTDENGDAIDITGYTYYYTVKRNRNDSDANALILKEITTHTDPTNGVTQIELLSADTLNKSPGSYLYNYIECNTSGQRKVLYEGNFILKQSIGDSICP